MRKLIAILWGFSLVAAIAISAALPSHAVEIRSNNAATVEGKNICAGPPQSGDALIFEGGQWCNGISNNVPLNGFLSNGTRTPELFVGTDNRFLIGDGTNDVGLEPFSALDVTSTGGIKWHDDSGGGGFDTQETFQQRSTLTMFLPGTMAGLVQWGDYEPQKPMHIRGFTIALTTLAAGCTTQGQFEVSLNNTPQAASLCTLSNGLTGCIVAGFSIAAAAGTDVACKLVTNPAGCTTTPANANCIIEYTTD